MAKLPKGLPKPIKPLPPIAFKETVSKPSPKVPIFKMNPKRDKKIK